MTQISIRLPAYYKDNMILQQGVVNRIFGQTQANSEMTIILEKFSTSQPNKEEKKNNKRLKAALSSSIKTGDAESRIVFSDKEKADSRGFFIFDLPAYEGSNDHYKLSLRVGNKCCTLNKIYFGEVWLAIGESNMAMPTRYTDVKAKIIAYSKLKKIRFFKMTEYGLSVGEEDFLYHPTAKIVEGEWIIPNQNNLLDVSAIALSFAANLQSDLKIPVGVYDLGARDTMIHSWLPRQVIEENQIIKEHMIEIQHYRDKNNWNDFKFEQDSTIRQTILNTEDHQQSIFPSFTKRNQPGVMFNHKLAPLTGLSIRGILFAHGESDVHFPDYYLTAFKAFSQVIKEQFHSFKRGPYLLYSQLTPYFHSLKDDKTLAYFNEALTIARRQLSLAAGMTTVYDLPLDYDKNSEHAYAKPLNPIAKATIGKRMYRLAKGLVYQEDVPKSSPEIKYAERIADKFLLSFANVGTGLKTLEGDLTLKGFNICEKGSPYLPAEANKLFGIRTLIWHPEIKNPSFCSYAFSNFNQSANLKNSDGMPVVPFRLEKDQPDNSLSREWMYCDKLESWIVPVKEKYSPQMLEKNKPGYFPLWQICQGNAELDLEKTNKRSSSGALLIRYDKADQTPIIFEPILHYASLYPPLDLSFWKHLNLEIFNADHVKKRIYIYMEDSLGSKVKSEVGLIEDVLAWQKIRFRIEKMPINLKEIVSLQFLLESNAPKGELTLDSVKCSTMIDDIEY